MSTAELQVSEARMNLTLKVWRQKDARSEGRLVTYQAPDVLPDMSFLEMLDVVNEDLIAKGEEPIAFDSDCREGICGTCSMMINESLAHGGRRGTSVCQLHMLHFRDGDNIVIEPWRARAFPVLKDLVTDRGAFDRIIWCRRFRLRQHRRDARCQRPAHRATDTDTTIHAAACIGCGACVAACKNASAMLFVAAKVSHLAALPQGQVEREQRVRNMVKTMDEAVSGNCTVRADKVSFWEEIPKRLGS